jgi:hypothetical protein
MKGVSVVHFAKRKIAEEAEKSIRKDRASHRSNDAPSTNAGQCRLECQTASEG